MGNTKALLLNNKTITQVNGIRVLLTTKLTRSVGNLDSLSSILGGLRLLIFLVGANPCVG